MTEITSPINPVRPAKFSNLSRLASEILIITALGFAPSTVVFANCYDRETNQDLARPIVGNKAKLIHICETQEAANYLVEAMRTNNQLQKEKAKAVCYAKSEFGEVTHNYGGYWYADNTNNRRRYVESVAIRDDLFGKQIYGVASGCGDLLTAEDRLKEAFKQAEAEAKALEERRKKDEAGRAVLFALGTEKAAANVLDKMTTRITRVWRRPVAFKGGLEVYLRMSLASNGELVDVRVVKTSGDVLFDRSAVTAVKRAAPFDEVKQFDAATFEEKFRSLTMKFRPED